MKYLILLLLLSGCSAQQFKKTGDNETVIIHWPKENRSYMAVRENCLDDARACVKIIGGGEIIMYAEEPMDAEDLRQFQTLGHEFLHGVWDEPGTSWHGDY